jgi:hypothetical protein
MIFGTFGLWDVTLESLTARRSKASLTPESEELAFIDDGWTAQKLTEQGGGRCAAAAVDSLWSISAPEKPVLV